MRLTRRIRVMRVIARLNIGGPAQHAIWLNAGLDRRGFETLLVSGSPEPGEGQMWDMVRQHGIRHELVPELGRRINGIRDSAASLALVRLMRRFRPDVVHTHTAKAGALGRIAARILRVPMIVHTFHGHVFSGYFPDLLTRGFLAIERWLARLSDVIIAISPSQATDLIQRYRVAPATKVRIIPIGLPLEPFSQGAPRGVFRRAFAIPEDRFLIGCVSRLVQIKNTRLLLEAIALLTSHNGEGPWCCAIVGDGPERPALERYVAQLGLERHVRFCGWWRDLPSLYADVDLVTLTSNNEGTPVSLIEAMASAKPVVTTAVGGVVDLVEDGVTGVLVPPCRAEALANAFERLRVDPSLRERMGAAGQHRMRERYAVERLVTEIAQLYQASMGA